MKKDRPYSHQLRMAWCGALLESWFLKRRASGLEVSMRGVLLAKAPTFPVPVPLLGLSPKSVTTIMGSKTRLTTASATASGKLVLGLVKKGDGSLTVRDAGVSGASLAVSLNTALAETLAKHHLRLNWTSLQLNFGTASRWHADEAIPGRVGIVA